MGMDKHPDLRQNRMKIEPVTTAALIGGGATLLSGLGGGLFGGSAGRDLRRLAGKGFNTSDIQQFLPTGLRKRFTGPIIQSGIQGIGELIRNPGGLSPSIAESILPRLAGESESIAQQFRGIGANQAGAAARGNLPLSIKTALESALDVSQERAQRGARREAQVDSESLRRADLLQVFQLLDTIFQFTNAGRQTAAGLSGAQSQLDAQGRGGALQAIGSILGGLASRPSTASTTG